MALPSWRFAEILPRPLVFMTTAPVLVLATFTQMRIPVVRDVTAGLSAMAIVLAAPDVSLAKLAVPAWTDAMIEGSLGVMNGAVESWTMLPLVTVVWPLATVIA